MSQRSYGDAVGSRDSGRWRSPRGHRSSRPRTRATRPEGYACGGVCACSTCHVYVTRGAELLSEKKTKRPTSSTRRSTCARARGSAASRRSCARARSRSRSRARASRRSRTSTPTSAAVHEVASRLARRTPGPFAQVLTSPAIFASPASSAGACVTRSIQSAMLQHRVLAHAARGHRGRADADAGGVERLSRVEGDAVVVEDDARAVERLRERLAGRRPCSSRRRGAGGCRSRR